MLSGLDRVPESMHHNLLPLNSPEFNGSRSRLQFSAVSSAGKGVMNLPHLRCIRERSTLVGFSMIRCYTGRSWRMPSNPPRSETMPATSSSLAKLFGENGLVVTRLG